jgi:hypothetical protein
LRRRVVQRNLCRPLSKEEELCIVIYTPAMGTSRGWIKETETRNIARQQSTQVLKLPSYQAKY